MASTEEVRMSNDVLEVCLCCGWQGTEEEKVHFGMAEMKGPGICPSCGGNEFDRADAHYAETDLF